MKSRQKRREAIEKKVSTETEISNMVPLTTAGIYSSGIFGKKLQQAHDLFHQQEYEQASYLYRDLLMTRADCEEIILGLSSCFYFLKEYERALYFISSLSGIHNTYIIGFTNACLNAVEESENESKSGKENEDKGESGTKSEENWGIPYSSTLGLLLRTSEDLRSAFSAINCYVERE